MQTTVLNSYQKHVVDLMANVDEAQQTEISNLLSNVFAKPNEQNKACFDSAMARKRRMKSNYFAQKAFDAVDALWDSGAIGENTIEEWKREHMRTPYHE